ncbi:MAG: amidohydrolase family protein [Dehalococcoidia bacterium]
MTTVIRAGSLIDGTGRDPIENATIVIEENRIVSVGSNGEIPRGAEVIDASGMTVMPGMIDCHVHLLFELGSIQQQLLTPFSLAVVQGLQHAKATLEAGFTSVRDAAGTPRGVKMAIDQGLVPGPRLRISVNAMSQTGGHGDQMMPNGAEVPLVPLGPETPHAVADGVEQVRQVTRQLLRAGADVIKLCSTGGVLSPADEPDASQFSPEEIATLVYEARAAGKTAMAHAQGTQGIQNAVLAGVGSIEHGIFLTEEVCEQMKQRGTYLVPTLVAPVWVIRKAEANPGSVPPYGVRKSREVIESHKASFRMAVELGVPIAMGTDMAVGPHGLNAEELELMCQGGMTPMQAIVATTKTAADCIRMGSQVGTVEPGKLADLIAVDGDPLADIRLLQNQQKLMLIMKDGQIFKDSRPLNS